MTQILKYFNLTFFESTYLGHKIVINRTNKTDVNYSKLVNKILGPYRFKEVILTRQFIKTINTYFTNKKIDNHINKILSVSHLCNLTNNMFYQVKGNYKINGTYGPIEFIDYILNLCDNSNHLKLKDDYKTKILNILKKYNINDENLINDILSLN